MSKMLSKMNLISVVQQLPKEDIETIQGYVEMIEEENQELKKQLEEINKMIEKCGFVNIEQLMLSYCGLIVQQKEFIKYLELEKDCFVRGCSNVYEDSLGETRLVNEDIFDEIDNILQKYKETIGDDK